MLHRKMKFAASPSFMTFFLLSTPQFLFQIIILYPQIYNFMWEVISDLQEVSIWGETAKKWGENGEKKLKNHDKKVGAVILIFHGGKSTRYDIIFFS